MLVNNLQRTTPPIVTSSETLSVDHWIATKARGNLVDWTAGTILDKPVVKDVEFL